MLLPQRALHKLCEQESVLLLPKVQFALAPAPT